MQVGDTSSWDQSICMTRQLLHDFMSNPRHVDREKNNTEGAEGHFIPGISESFQLEAIIEQNESLLVLKWNRIWIFWNSTLNIKPDLRLINESVPSAWKVLALL